MSARFLKYRSHICANILLNLIVLSVFSYKLFKTVNFPIYKETVGVSCALETHEKGKVLIYSIISCVTLIKSNRLSGQFFL